LTRQLTLIDIVFLGDLGGFGGSVIELGSLGALAVQSLILFSLWFSF
jgi:hypothetical protein